MRLVRVLAASLPLLLIVGCGDDPSDGGTEFPRAAAPVSKAGAPAFDPCVLVTRAEADQALGGDAAVERPPEGNPAPNLATCRYTAQRGPGVAVLTVMVRTGYSENEAKTQFDGTKALGQAQPVANLGDDAFWLADQLWVLHGTRALTISGSIDKATGEGLARQAVARLK